VAPGYFTGADQEFSSVNILRLVNGFKDVENRPRRTHYRGPLLIHAGLNLAGYTENIEWVQRKDGISVPPELELDTGGIVGVVDLIDCVESHKSKWFNGPFGWVLANPRRLKFRLCKGALGLFRPKY
jgi:hypothetical protein